MQNLLSAVPSPSRPPLPIAPSPSDESGSFVLRFGTAVGLAAAAALACALPAAMRVAAVVGSEATSQAWMGLASAALGPMVFAVFVLRGAREGLRAFSGSDAELRAYGAVLWAQALLILLALLGSVLRATTHHHALAGVTFAVGALGLAIGSALATARTVTILRTVSSRTRRAAEISLALVSLALLAWLGVRFLRAASRDTESAPAAGTVVDIFAFALAAQFAARRSLASRRLLALIGPPVAVAVAAMGLSALRERSLRAAIEDRAPAFALLVQEAPHP